MATGVIKWFNAVTGYGMIQPDDGSQAGFVDIGAVERARLPGLRKDKSLLSTSSSSAAATPPPS